MILKNNELFLILCLTILFYSCKNEKGSNNYEIINPIIDIGNVKQGNVSEVIFKIKNISNSNILIENVKSDCHCTVPNWSKSPIKPNEIYNLLVTYDNSNLGFFEQTISVYFKNSIPSLLIIRGKVLP